MKYPAHPRRLVDLPVESGLSAVGSLIRAAGAPPGADTPRVKWRIRNTLRTRSEQRGRWLRFALVGVSMFVMGGVVGAAVQPLLRVRSLGSAARPEPDRAAHGGHRVPGGERPRSPTDLAPPALSREPEGAVAAAAGPATPAASATERAAPPRSVGGRSSNQAETSHRSAEAAAASPRIAAATPAPVMPAPRAALPSLPPASLPASLPPPASVAVAAPPPASEQALIATALDKLRIAHEPQAALAALDDYGSRFPSGILAPEAARLRTEALLLLGRKSAVLDQLDRAALSETITNEERLVLRGELRAAAGRWSGALADFDAVVRARATSSASAEDQRSCERLERALWGRASARSRLDDQRGARDDLDEYLRRFPDGRFADQANRLLEEHRRP